MSFLPAPSANVPRAAYVCAVAAGLVGLPLMGSLAHPAAEMWEGGDLFSVLIIVAGFVLGNAALGAAFGSLWPGAGWRWGVWLCAAPSCAVPYFATDVGSFLAWVLLSMPAACAGAHAARGLHLRYFGAP